MKGRTKTKPSRRADGDGRLEALRPVRRAAPCGTTATSSTACATCSCGPGPVRAVSCPIASDVTSAIRGEGVTFVARSLALVLAHDAGKRVCLLDVNWWSPGIWPGKDPNLAGVADVIRGTVALRDALIETDHPMLEILPRGATRSSERPVLANHPELRRVLDELSGEFDHVDRRPPRHPRHERGAHAGQHLRGRRPRGVPGRHARLPGP